MAEKLKKIAKHGTLKSKIASRCVSWCVQNFCVIWNEKKNVRSDYFRVCSSPSCLFYLSLEFDTEDNFFFVHVNRSVCNSFTTKLTSVNIAVSFEDECGVLHFTKIFDMAADMSCIKSPYRLAEVQKYLIKGILHVGCSVTLTESEQSDSEKNYERIQNKFWSHCSVITSNELKEHIAILLEDDATNKVMIKVDGEFYPVHRNLLCSYSPVFSAMFSHDTLENRQNIIHVSDVRKEVIGEMLKFLYTGCTSALSPIMNMELYAAADKYAISTLKERCSKFLSSALNRELVLDILALAHQHADDKLKNTAIEFLVEKSPNLLKSEDFLSFIGSECEITQDIILYLVKHNMK